MRILVGRNIYDYIVDNNENNFITVNFVNKI